MKIFDNLTNKQFGRLTVLEQVENDRWGKQRWKCQCSCKDKIIRIINRNDLLQGKTKSCGCLRKETSSQKLSNQTHSRKQYGESSKNKLLYSYKQHAKKRNLKFELTFDEFINLTQQNCFYCGEKPNQIQKDKRCFGDFIYNGIDRINNNLGYTLENCVPCCKTCNFAKNNILFSDFMIWINKLLTYRNNVNWEVT